MSSQRNWGQNGSQENKVPGWSEPIDELALLAEKCGVWQVRWLFLKTDTTFISQNFILYAVLDGESSSNCRQLQIFRIFTKTCFISVWNRFLPENLLRQWNFVKLMGSTDSPSKTAYNVKFWLMNVVSVFRNNHLKCQIPHFSGFRTIPLTHTCQNLLILGHIVTTWRTCSRSWCSV